jgi:hypothetical protein
MRLALFQAVSIRIQLLLVLAFFQAAQYGLQNAVVVFQAVTTFMQPCLGFLSSPSIWLAKKPWLCFKPRLQLFFAGWAVFQFGLKHSQRTTAQKMG